MQTVSVWSGGDDGLSKPVRLRYRFIYTLAYQADPSRRAEVINGLYSALQAKGLQTAVGILADESSSLSLATSEVTTWLPSVIDKAGPDVILPINIL
jgi:hypothetical protein